jgi:hypothetical protein
MPEFPVVVAAVVDFVDVVEVGEVGTLSTEGEPDKAEEWVVQKQAWPTFLKASLFTVQILFLFAFHENVTYYSS